MRIKPEILDLDGEPVGLLRAGPTDGPSILLIHGFSGDLLTWQYQIMALARHYRVIAVDLPGHGRTGCAQYIGFWPLMVDWLHRVLDRLALHDLHLVGHSLGARLTLGLAERGRITARSISLIACAGITPDYDYAFLHRLSTLADQEQAIIAARHLLGGSSLDPTRFAATLLQKLGTELAHTHLARYLADNFADGRLKAASPLDWSGITCPVQAIWGSDDAVVAPPRPGFLPLEARLHLLDKVGHLPHLTAPAAVNHLLLNFLASSGIG